MASIRSIIFQSRLLVQWSAYRIVAKRSIKMSSVQKRSEKVIEEMKGNNPYFEKYAQKIAAIQKSSPEEFLSRLDKVEKEKMKPKFGPQEAQRDYSELLKAKSPLSTAATKEEAHRKLNDIMRLELLEDKSADDIKHLWFEYHKDKDVITAAIPIDQYNLMMARAQHFPIFILPIPRSQGYEFMMLQFAGNTVHLTPLLSYQVHKENAPECLKITMFSECREKGVVLMRGEYDKNVVNAQEAQCLANQLQLYYSQNNPKKLQLLETFNKKPEQFKYMDIIEELNDLKI